MGGSTRQTTKGKQETILPQNQQTNVDLLMTGAKNLYQSGGPKYFEGQNYTTADPLQTQGRQLVAGYAGGAGQQLVDQAQQANSFWMNPQNVYDLSRTPGYSASRQGIVDTVNQQLLESWMPANRGAAISGGALGGSRQGMMDALAMGRASGELGKSLAGLDLEVSGRNMQMADAALGRAPTMYQLGTAPGSTMSQVGALNRADLAEKLQADMNRWNFDQNKEGQMLALLQALTGTSGQYGGIVKSKQTTQQQSDPTGQILGAALMAGSMFLPGLGAAGAAGAAGGGGAVGAGLAGSQGWQQFAGQFGQNLMLQPQQSAW